MGGSSLAPEVLRKVFGVRDGFLDVRVLDSTDPAAVLAIEEELDLCRTLFIVSSKSGGTTETASFHAYFYERLTELEGLHAGEHFIAITDEGTSLQQEAVRPVLPRGLHEPVGHRRPLLGAVVLRHRPGRPDGHRPAPPARGSVGGGGSLRRGRAARRESRRGPGRRHRRPCPRGTRQGDDRSRPRSWRRSAPGSSSCWPRAPARKARACCPWTSSRWARRRTTVTTACSCTCAWKAPWTRVRRPAWPPWPPAGQPVVTVRLSSEWELGGEFLRWEIATALAGALIGIDAFDQPNVQESKDNTKRLLAGYTQSGTLPDAAGGGDRRGRCGRSCRPPWTLCWRRPVPATTSACRRTSLRQRPPGPRWGARALRCAGARAWPPRPATGPASCTPRASTTRAAPTPGCSCSWSAAEARDAPIPGQLYSFGTLKRAQAEGDLASLRSHGRRVLRVELGPDPLAGLRAVSDALAGAAGQSRLSGDAAAERAESSGKGSDGRRARSSDMTEEAGAPLIARKRRAARTRGKGSAWTLP